MIGIIVKVKQPIEELGKNWIPEDIDLDDFQKAFLETIGFIPDQNKFSYENNEILIHFTVDNLQHPKSVSFNCVANDNATSIINKIASTVKAKIYDSEVGDFVKL